MANERSASVRRSEPVYRDTVQSLRRAFVRRSEFVYRDGEQKGRVRTEKRTCISTWRTKAARVYGEANLCIGMANKSVACVRRSESMYQDVERKKHGYAEKRTCISGCRTQSAWRISLQRACVRRSELVYRDSERKMRVRVRRSEPMYRDGERKSAGVYGEANLCIKMANKRSAGGISLQHAFVRRSEPAYRDSEQKARGTRPPATGSPGRRGPSGTRWKGPFRRC